MRKAAILGIASIMVLFINIPSYGLNPTKNVTYEAPSARRINQLNFPALYLCQPNLEGEAVWIVQARLRELGFETEPDGKYSPRTSYCVSMFQLAHGMEDDGIVTPRVWKALMGFDTVQPCLSPEEENKERISIIIDVNTRVLALSQNDKEIRRYPVAVGKYETPTPLGEWAVVQKGVGWGNAFGSRWLGLNVPWGIFGIHGTDRPHSIGTYASHGCIRMLNRDVEDLYSLIPLGTTVKIVDKGRMLPEKIKPVPLKKGASGQKVVYIQSRLRELGVAFDKADGRYGNMTELAVKYFQIWHNLDPSGQMDEETYWAMGLIK